MSRRSKVLHNSPRNSSDAVEAQEFDARIANTTPEENPGLHDPNIPLLDAKMIHPEFEVVPGLDAEKMKKLEALRFNEERVTVDILDTEDENADFSFVIQVGDEKQPFYRGGRFTVKRKFIEGLARARPVSFSPTKDRTGEITANSYRARRGEKYPFAVYHDPNPKGRDWLRQIRQQP